MNNGRVTFCLFLAAIVLFSGCKETPAPAAQGNTNEPATAEQAGSPSPTPTPDLPRPSGPIEFTDVTAQSGIRFKHNSGAFGKKYLPETIGSGCAFLDYDNDGWQDILLINSMDWPGHRTGTSFPALYHNNQDGTFTDVTHQAGLALEMYGLGCTVGDYDNDGKDDIYITTLGSNHLFHNLGNGKFQDVTAKAGVADPGFSVSAVWFDYDNDGKLDLFVTNDTEPNKLYHNNRNGTFTDVGVAAGLAYGDAGTTRAGMGTDAADYDNSGWQSVVIGNFTNEGMALYHNDGSGLFTDDAPSTGIARISTRSLTF